MIACLFPVRGSQAPGLGGCYPRSAWVAPLSEAMTLDLEHLSPDAECAVAARGRAMAATCERSSTAMVAASAAHCRARVETVPEQCPSHAASIANVNSSVRVVLAGPRAAVDAEVHRTVGGHLDLRQFDLRVAGAFHTHRMTSAGDVEVALRPLVNDQRLSPVISNADGAVHTTGESLMNITVWQVVPARWDLRGSRSGDLGVTSLWESASRAGLSGFVRRGKPSRRSSRVSS